MTGIQTAIEKADIASGDAGAASHVALGWGMRP